MRRTIQWINKTHFPFWLCFWIVFSVKQCSVRSILFLFTSHQAPESMDASSNRWVHRRYSIEDASAAHTIQDRRTSSAALKDRKQRKCSLHPYATTALRKQGRDHQGFRVTERHHRMHAVRLYSQSKRTSRGCEIQSWCQCTIVYEERAKGCQSTGWRALIQMRD